MPKKRKIEEKPEVKETKEKEKRKVKTPALLRGMRDILPLEQKYWDFIISRVEKIAQDYGFGRIETPVLEETNLFTRSIGKQTDVVEKEMFSFLDPGGENVSLRPEFTAGAARAYIEHGMFNLPQPVKLYYLGPVFRHNRPQSGRYRQFCQLGYEIMGDGHPVIDTQLILLSFNICKELGLEVNIQVNSVGCLECRNNYLESLVNYYKARRKLLCNDCQRRLVKNPLRLLDCKVESCQALRDEAPQMVDWLCEVCKNHFIKVLEYLDETGVPYILNPTLVRGLDYYTKTVFEIWSIDDEKGHNALGAGGRYDNLITDLGGRPTPASGVSFGTERLLSKLRAKEIAVPELTRPEIFLAHLGEAAKKKALVFFEELRNNDIKVAAGFSKDGLKPQLEIANKLAVKFTLILGQKEVLDKTVLIRDMDGGIQDVVDYDKAIEEVKKRLSI